MQNGEEEELAQEQRFINWSAAEFDAENYQWFLDYLNEVSKGRRQEEEKNE